MFTYSMLVTSSYLNIISGSVSAVLLVYIQYAIYQFISQLISGSVSAVSVLKTLASSF